MPTPRPRAARPEQLLALRKAARDELGAAGAPALAAKTEQLRERWVADRMVELGRARAASLGWPDAYAYTKSLGEQALLENRGAVPVNIVRPSIIESSWSEPRPGWIRGFRMAEPILISYARGLLKQFPGVPEGVVDVIPVDLVVGALCTVAALGPDEAPRIVQVASGTANPLKYRFLVDNVKGWFDEHPVYDSLGQPIAANEFEYVVRGKVQAQLKRATKVLAASREGAPLAAAAGQAGRVVGAARGAPDRAGAGPGLRGALRQLRRVRGALLGRPPPRRWRSRSRPTTGRPSGSTRASSTGAPTSATCTCPRSSSTPGSRRRRARAGARTAWTGSGARCCRQQRHLAAFDLENTLIASNVVESYSWLATRRLPKADRVRFALRTLAEAPGLLSLDRKDRGDFLRYFYRRYEGASVEQIDEDARELFSAVILTKSFPAAIRRVREHKAAGHRTVLITGALDFAVKPLEPLFDEIIAARLSVTPSGRYTGELATTPPTGETRAQLLADYCAAEGLLLEESVAYADSTSDLPLLEAVGFPVAVNPETRLAALARKRGWLVEHWEKAPGRAAAAAARSGRPMAASPAVATGEAGDEGPAHRPQAGPLRRGPRGRVAAARQRCRRRAAASWPTSTRPSCPARDGCSSGPAWPASAAPTCRPSTAPPAATSSRSSASPSCPATRWSPTPTTTAAVVLEPVLGCVARGISPLCVACARGDLGGCERLAFGHLEPGLQTGFCADTGGGWGTFMVAHESQLHPVPEAMTDEAAVMVEPTACAVHAALTRRRDRR